MKTFLTPQLLQYKLSALYEYGWLSQEPSA